MAAHVVVVGGGLSGLCAAERLTAANIRVTVLEAAPRLGGRNLVAAVAPNTSVVIDAGGQWFGARQGAALSLARRFQLSLQPQYCTGRRVLSVGGVVSTYAGLIPSVSLGILVDAQLALVAVKVLQFAVYMSPTGAVASKLDSVTVEQFMNACMWTAGGRALLRIVVQALLGRETSDSSLLSVVRYINASGSVEAMSEMGPGSLQAWTIVGGAQQLTLRLAACAEAGGATIRTGSRVVAVRRNHPNESTAISAGSSPVEVETDSGEVIPCTHVIVALPTPLAASLNVFPSPPAERVKLATSATMGAIIKTIIIYKEAFWRRAGFSGEAIVDVASDPRRGPAFNFFDACVPVPEREWASIEAALTSSGGRIEPATGGAHPVRLNAMQKASPSALGVYHVPLDREFCSVDPQERYLYLPALVAFINAAAATAASATMTSAARRAAVLTQVASLYSASPSVAGSPLAYIEKDWVSDPYTRGCPTASWGRGGSAVSLSTAAALAAPCWPDGIRHRLFFAGTETSDVGTGFMDGAVRAGHRAAAQVTESVLGSTDVLLLAAAATSDVSRAIDSARPAPSTTTFTQETARSDGNTLRATLLVP